MSRGQAVSLVACAALAGVAIASVPRGAGLGLLAAGGAAGYVVGLWLVRGERRGAARDHPLDSIALPALLARSCRC